MGYISQAQYELIDGKCKGKGQDLPDDCVAELDKVLVLKCRSMSCLMGSIFTISLSLASKTTT